MWVIKAGENDDPNEPPHYLVKWDITKPSGDNDRMRWEPSQTLAYRFADRNHAVSVATSFPIEAYDDAVRVVRLRPAQSECDPPVKP